MDIENRKKSVLSSLLRMRKLKKELSIISSARCFKEKEDSISTLREHEIKIEEVLVQDKVLCESQSMISPELLEFRMRYVGNMFDTLDLFEKEAVKKQKAAISENLKLLQNTAEVNVFEDNLKKENFKISRDKNKREMENISFEKNNSKEFYL